MNQQELKKLQKKPVSTLEFGVEMSKNVINQFSKQEKTSISDYPEWMNKPGVTQFTNLRVRVRTIRHVEMLALCQPW